MLLTHSYSAEWGGEYVHIDELFVKQKYRKSGIGSSMLKFVEDKYKEKAVGITLLVNEENKDAKKLYKKRGFDVSSYSQMFKILK